MSLGHRLASPLGPPSGAPAAATAPGAGDRPPLAPVAIEEWESLAGVLPADWDRMAGNRVLYSHGFLRAIEQSAISDQHRRYFVARGQHGLLGAVFARLHLPAAPSPGSLDGALYGRGLAVARALGLSTLPALTCGLLYSISSPCVIDAGLPAEDQASVQRQLLAHVRALCEERGWSLALRTVPRDGSGLAADLDPRGWLRTSELPVTCLDIEWRSFDGYVDFLRRRHRHMAKNVKYERSLARRHRLAIERWPEAPSDPRELHALLDAHNRRLNAAPFPFEADLLPRLADALGERALIRVARIGGQLAGVTIALRDDEDAHMLLVGIDPPLARPAGVLGNLCYNESIRELSESGCRRLYFGRMLYDYKARRGCRLIDHDLWLADRRPLRRPLLAPILALRSRLLDRRTAGLPRRGAAPEPLP